MSATVSAVSKSEEWNSHVTSASVKVATFWIWMLGICLFYIVVLAHTPITVLVSAAHDDGYYMKFGRLLAEGSMDEVQGDERVKEVYLGH